MVLYALLPASASAMAAPRVLLPASEGSSLSLTGSSNSAGCCEDAPAMLSALEDLPSGSTGLGSDG